ncbi:MAG: hypothetical protein LBM77_10240 [Spirochaetaceae bacterium]|jgi:hypothetical protein|nr:hypothetical protein [Spirochaetaceae bacterium]
MTIFLSLCGNIWGQDSTNTAKSIALFPISTNNVVPANYANNISGLINDAVNASSTGPFDVKISNNLPSDPALSPDVQNTQNQNYSLTSALYRNDATGEIQAQVWLWDNRTQKLVITDQMVFSNIPEATEFTPPLIDYVLSQIPETTTTVAVRRDEVGNLNIAEEEKIQIPRFGLNLAYSPLILFVNNNQDLERGLYHKGASAFFDWTITHDDWGRFGLGIKGSMSFLENTTNQDYSTELWLITPSIQAIYETPRFANALGFQTSLGFGVGLPLWGHRNFPDGTTDDLNSTEQFHITAEAGVLLKYYITDLFSMLIGADFNLYFLWQIFYTVRLNVGLSLSI